MIIIGLINKLINTYFPKDDSFEQSNKIRIIFYHNLFQICDKSDYYLNKEYIHKFLDYSSKCTINYKLVISDQCQLSCQQYHNIIINTIRKE